MLAPIVRASIVAIAIAVAVLAAVVAPMWSTAAAQSDTSPTDAAAGSPLAGAVPLGAAARVPLAGYIEVLRDAAGAMSWREAAAGDFSPLTGDFNAGYSGGAWWLRFTVVPDAAGAGEWWLAAGAPYTDLIDVYGPLPATGGAEPPHEQAGASLPIPDDELPLPRTAVRLEVGAGTPQTFLMRLGGARSIGARPILWRLPAFLHDVAITTVIFSTLIGAALFAAVGSFIFGIWLRSRAFAWYGAYVGTTALVFALNNGFVATLLDDLSPAAFLRLHGVVGCLSIMSACFTVLAIFPVPRRVWPLGWALAGVGVGAGVSAVLSLFGLYGLVAPYLMMGVLLLTASAPGLALHQVMLRAPGAVWNFVGFSGYSVASWWFALSNLGLVPLTAMSIWGPQLIAWAHMVVTFCVLAAALRAGSKERRELQAELLAASRQNERVLEIAVAQRTEALEAEVAARRRAEAALLVALREQQHFLVVVSHEFRTPLATIRAAIATIMQGRLGPDDDVVHEAAKVERSVGRLTKLIDNLLTEASLERAARTAPRMPVDLRALVDDLRGEQGEHSGRRIRVEGVVPAFPGNPGLIRTALDNLLSNALKYSDGPVSVLLTERDAGVALEVVDRGVGIAPEEQGLVFERYYRTEAAKTRPGAGVGLSIARTVVEAHGGTLSVRSAPGAGSTFEIFLPRPTQQPLSLRRGELRRHAAGSASTGAFSPQSD